MIFKLTAAPYDVEIVFALDEPDDRVFRYLRQAIHAAPSLIEDIKRWDKDRPTFTGRTNRFDSGAILIRMRTKVVSPATIALLGHEILHAVIWILGEAGIQFGTESEEAYTYLQQDLMKRVLRRAAKEWWK